MSKKIDKRHKLTSANNWVESGKRALVKSSNVRAITYDMKNQILYVEFHGGGFYRYNDVPIRVAKSMYNCPSMGKFVWQKLRDHYSFERLDS